VGAVVLDMLLVGKMAETERAFLERCWNDETCPYCGQKIPSGTRVGTGRKQDGGFCSLDCLARYRAMELKERLQRLAGRNTKNE
jgi:hypothetical protein